MGHLRKALLVALVGILVVTGCSRLVDGRATEGLRQVDQADFFAGEVPLYGQTVSANDRTALAYLRAIRRIDVCGLATRDALAKIGEIISLGTFFNFNECNIEFKVSGVSSRQFASVALLMSPTPRGSPAFRVGGSPVYPTGSALCDYLLPLPLDRLPDAGQLQTVDKPHVEVKLYGRQDCELARRIAATLAAQLATSPLPLRDGLATYSPPLAERDPCEVLAVLSDDVDGWDIVDSQPYECLFSVSGFGNSDPASLRVRLAPQVVDDAEERDQRREQAGIELYVNPLSCSVTSFVGAPLQRDVVGGGQAAPLDVVVRPAVVVDGDTNDCNIFSDVAVRAVPLYS